MEYERLKLHHQLNGGETTTVTTADYSDDLVWLFDKINEADLERSHSYIVDHRLTSKTLCYTMTYIKDEPVLASLAWNRPMYNGIIRLVTRYCINPAYAHMNFGKGTDGMRLDTVDHILQQMDFCQKLGYQDFFVARHDKSKGRRTRKIAKVISKYTGQQWHASDEEMLLCPNVNDPSCYQYVAYNNRKDFKHEDI